MSNSFPRGGLRRWLFLSCILFALSFGAGSSALAQASADSPNKYIVILDGESAAQTFVKMKTANQSGNAKAANDSAEAAARARRAEIASQHDAFSAQLKALGVKEIGRHGKLLNAVVIRAEPGQLEAIRRLPGVKRVCRAQLYEVNT